jgi:antitoxin component YwqK of YwqJK toxin-antitoxin module
MKNFYFLVALLLLFSCNSSSHKNKLSKSDSTAQTVSANHKEVAYYDDGQIKFVQEYFNGIKHGVYKNWYEEGTIRTMGNYCMGFRKGVWSWYSEKGRLDFQVNYDNQVASL